MTQFLLMLFLCQQPPQCNQSLWDRVYHKSRLRIIQPCITVSGSFVTFKREPDGDLHIRMKVDPEFASLLNARNLSVQRGNLVVEPVCERPVTQTDVGHTCDGYKSALAIPKKGIRVSVTGPLVLDLAHGWVEIHPISQIAVLPQ